MPLKSEPIAFFKRYNLQARPQQLQVLDTLKAEWDNYKYFVLNLPTGVGKTFVACATADSSHGLGRAYLLTSTLQLQAQYEKSWDQIVNLKGRGNYTCNLNPEFQVDSAPCAAQSELKRACIEGNVCSYYNQKNKALQSKAMITNPVYFLYSTHCGFGADDPEKNPWIKREALIVDEAHNLEGHLVSFAQSKIAPEELFSEHGVRVGGLKFTGMLMQDYQTLEKIRAALMEKAEELETEIAEAFPQQGHIDPSNVKKWARALTDKVAERVKKLNTKAYALDKALQPLNIFFNTHDTPEELERRWLMHADTQENTMQLSPLYGDFLFDTYIEKMAEKFVFMSATLGTKEQFCKELGIPLDECLYIETDTPFPPEKSPIIGYPMLKLGYKDLPQTLPSIGPLLATILDEHKDQKGIIHCATYKLAEEIYKRIDQPYRDRILTRDMDALDSYTNGKSSKYSQRYRNEKLLEFHAQNRKGDNSVLMSPSMMEGVDLVDDLSEFQIILKMPWANLNDPRVKRKSELDNDWYTNAVWVHIMQASGRSTRHENDESVTYILDSSFPYFYDKWKHRLPKWFKDRLVVAK